MKPIAELADRIEQDLLEKVSRSARPSEVKGYYKRKVLKYYLHKPDWVSYIDRSFTWINGQYALGLLSTGSPESIRMLTDYYDRLLLAKRLGLPVFEVPDQTIHAHVLLELYSRHGKKRYLPLIREAAMLLNRIAEQNDGLIVYWPPDKAVLVDTLGMISEFCYQYDQVFEGSALSSIAKQLIEYTEQFCIDPQSGFPFHSFDYERKTAEGSSSWGRGVGWYLLGLTAYVRRFGEKTERLEQVFESVFAHQDSDGFLYDDVLHPTHIDTSTTCMAALCLGNCIADELLPEETLSKFYEPIAKAVGALCSSVNEKGEVLNCSGECSAAGDYSTEFGNYFAQGYTLMLFRLIESNAKLQRILTPQPHCESSLKVGILTHYHHSLNYGGMLQSYALAKYLQQHGFQAEQVCYTFSSEPFLPPQKPVQPKPQENCQSSTLRTLFRRAYRSARYRLVYKRCEQYYADYKKTVLPRRASKFATFEDKVPHSQTECDPNTVSEFVKDYDCLITGSDQVWNFEWFNPAFFLDLPEHRGKKIAYAASAGKSEFCEQEKAYLKRTLSAFDAVSVREADLVDTLDHLLGTDAVEQTVDPTLLLTAQDWDEIASPRLIKEKYLFCYFLHNDASLSKLAKQFAREHHLKIAVIPFPGIEYNMSDVSFGKYRLDDADPSDFISLVKHAEYVFTDSFHATVFSLLYEKQFVSFPRGDARSMGSRLATLTELFGCKERFCLAEVSEREEYIASLPPIRSDHERFDALKKRSEAFLMRSLQND